MHFLHVAFSFISVSHFPVAVEILHQKECFESHKITSCRGQEKAASKSPRVGAPGENNSVYNYQLFVLTGCRLF
jgi:hypothetical protein